MPAFHLGLRPHDNDKDIDIDDLESEVEELGRIILKDQVIDCFEAAGAIVMTLFDEPEKARFPNIYVRHPSWRGFVDLLWREETLPAHRAFCAEHIEDLLVFRAEAPGIVTVEGCVLGAEWQCVKRLPTPIDPEGINEFLQEYTQ